jgi:acetyltransferase
VETVDQLMSVAQLCATGRLPGRGGVGLVTDSGGLREMVMDCAVEIDAPLARLSPATLASMRSILPPALEPSNPLDCAAELTDEFARVFERGIATMAAAPEVSMIGFEADLRDDYIYLEDLRKLALALPSLTVKPCFFYSSFARANNRQLADELADHGIPCLNGAADMLVAVRKVQEWSNRRLDETRELFAGPGPDDEIILKWRAALASGTAPDEKTSLELLSAFGVPAIRCAVAGHGTNWPRRRRGSATLALKTAERGMDHKSDHGGVRLGLADPASLRAAYDDLRDRIGPRVIVQPMAGKGVELAMGCVFDRDFGPLVMVSAGGTLIEYFSDRQFALAPFDALRALRMIDRLGIARLLAGVRGAPAKDRVGAAKALSAFSHMCALLGEALREVDVNPLVVTEAGAVAVDALVVPAARIEEAHPPTGEMQHAPASPDG